MASGSAGRSYRSSRGESSTGWATKALSGVSLRGQGKEVQLHQPRCRDRRDALGVSALIDELHLVDVASPVAMHDSAHVAFLEPVGRDVLRQRNDIVFL